MKRVSRLLVSALAPAVCASAGLVALAQPAAAAITDHESAITYTYAPNCTSVIMGYPYTERTMGLAAASRYDDAAPPRAGEVFYVAVHAGAVGDPYPCVGQGMRPDIVLPTGVSLAISGANPIRCTRWEYTGSTATPHAETALCPTAAQPPQSGGSASFGTSAGESWEMPTGTGWEIRIPVVSAQPGSPAVGFAIRVEDSHTNPLVHVTAPAVPVQPAATATPTPTPTPTPSPTPAPTPTPHPTPAPSPTGAGAQATAAASVAPLVRLDRTRGRVPVRAMAGPVGSVVRLTVRARVSGRWASVGDLRYVVSTTGPAKKLVRVGAKWRRVVAGKRVQARIVTRVVAPGGDVTTTTTSFGLKG